MLFEVGVRVDGIGFGSVVLLLFWVVIYVGYKNCVERFVNVGVNFNIKFFEILLFIVVCEGRVDCFKIFIEVGSNVNVKNNCG